MKITDLSALISFANPVSTGKSYRYTAALITISGCFYFTVLSLINEEAQLVILGVAGTLMTALICSIFNLTYFLKRMHPFIRFILPGALFIGFTLVVYSGATPDLYIFLGFGVLNQLAGIYWYLREKAVFAIR